MQSKPDDAQLKPMSAVVNVTRARDLQTDHHNASTRPRELEGW